MNKEILVLIPGMDGTCILFEEFIKTAPDGFDIVSVALPNDKCNNYIEYAEHVIQVLDKMGLLDNRISILAESFGGRIAYELLNHPKCNIRRIIFVASFLSRPSFISRFSSLLPLSMVERDWVPDWTLKLSLFGSLNAEIPLTLFKRAMQATPKASLRSRLKLIADLNPPSKVIPVPAIYLQATNDLLVSSKAAAEIQRLCKDFVLKKIKGGHFLLQSNPTGCWEAINYILHQEKENSSYHSD